MGFSLNFERNTSRSRHQTPKKGWDTNFPAHVRPTLDIHSKLKGVKCVSQTRPNPPQLSTECGNGGITLHSRMAGQSSRVKDKKDDELVRYMSSLPGYLQRLEKDENLHEKALNVGVLDWTRLEQWKGKQVTPSVGGKGPFASNKLLAKPRFPSSKFSHATRSDEHPPTSSNHVVSCSGGISQPSTLPVRNVMRFQDIGTSSKSGLVSNEETVLENAKRRNFNLRVASKVDNLSENSRNCGALVTPKQGTGTSGVEFRGSVEEIQQLRKEARDQKINSSMGSASSKLRRHVASLHAKEIRSNFSLESKKRTEGLQGAPISLETKNRTEELQASLISLETKKRTKGLQESSVLSQQPQAVEKKNIVLLVPKKYAKYRMPEGQITPMVKSYIKTGKHRLSHCISHDDDHSSEIHSEIPHSCALPSEAKINAVPCKTANDTINTQVKERLSDASLSSASSSKTQTRLSPHGYAAKRHTASDADILETLKVLDEESAELAARKGRHPSPNRRFSFSLSRISRSFSFKESSAIPQLNSDYISAKSGPVIADTASCPENPSRGKASCHNRARSSPLRRILEPLLKSKSTVPPHSVETLPPLREGLSSSSPKATKVMESSPAKCHGATNMQALLQVTVKNGLPLFRFVVSNNGSVLAATTNTLTSSGKHESANNYTFYSIDEFKKKSGSWRHQGSKEKNCSYVYNVVGQMKINNSVFLDATEQNSIGDYMVKEFVLCGVELRQVEQASPKFIPSSELAAVVVKVPQQSLTPEMLESEKDFAEKGFSESADNCTWDVRGNERQMRVTALLPGAIHSLPNKGGPSPLIHRWKSGGQCDCGGWDVGCKLRVLSNNNKCCDIPTNSSACLTSDHLQLFNQNEAPQDKPAFGFAPVEKGIYSVEFSQSISTLQAFFISITVISCQKSPELAEMGIRSEDNVFLQTKNTNDGTKKFHSTVETKTRLKFAPNPPISPVGRF